MGNTLLRLHIESPGTLYTPQGGASSSSLAGHVWMEIVAPGGESRAAGFAPLDPKGGVTSVAGEIYRNDERAYAGEPAFTATFQITEEQVVALSRYISAPRDFGFDQDNYHAVTNSCVDFVWKGLQQIGMNPRGFEGHTMPMANRDDFSTLKNPQIPGGGLVNVVSRDAHAVMEEPMVSPFNDWWWAAPAPSISVSPVPANVVSRDAHAVMEEPMVSPFNDWWWAAPAPWISVSPVPAEDVYLPRGTITVGPLGPPVPVQQDGTNYADGTGYQ